MRMLFAGPYRDFSGYASASRDTILALNEVGVDLTIRPLRYDCGNYSLDVLDKLEMKDLSAVDTIVNFTTPNEMEPKAGKFNIGMFCWETDRIPELWASHLNKMDLVIVPCQDNLLVARKCGVIVPIEKVHFACDTSRYTRDIQPFLFPEADNKFKFLSIFQYSKKKALDVLLKSYFAEFTSADNVCLIIKTYFGINDSAQQKQYVHTLVGAVKELLRLKDYPLVRVIHDVMSHDEIDRLYKTSDCYVLPSRGEGWGVPHFDALGFGLPAIATRGTGPEEFINESCGWLVNSHLSPVIDMPHPHEFLYTGKEKWHEPHADDLMRCMRQAYSEWSVRGENSRWNERCLASRNRVADFSHEKIGCELLEVITKYYRMWKNVH